MFFPTSPRAASAPAGPGHHRRPPTNHKPSTLNFQRDFKHNRPVDFVSPALNHTLANIGIEFTQQHSHTFVRVIWHCNATTICLANPFRACYPVGASTPLFRDHGRANNWTRWRRLNLIKSCLSTVVPSCTHLEPWLEIRRYILAVSLWAPPSLFLSVELFHGIFL